MSGLPASYLPPRRYRGPYRGGRPSSSAEKAAGLLLAAVVLSGVGATGVKVVRHHHAVPRQAAASGSEYAFIAAVMADLGAPDTQANAGSMAAWYPHENGSWPPAASDNPWNSTMPMPGSWIFNSVGVQNYPSPSEGAQAIALTLANGYYPLIVSSLRSGAGLCGNPSLAGEFLTWSGGGYQGVC